jgi:TPR repeat protein
MKNAIFAFLVTVYICAANAWAGYSEAVAAATKADYAGAYQQFSQLADKGDTDALVNMAILTGESCGLNKPPALGNDLICKAAGADNVHARFFAALSAMFAAPVCPTLKFTENEFPALTLASATRGNVAAMLWSGKIYENGRQRDPIRAYAWYTLAIERGAPEAQEEVDNLAPRLSADDRARAKELAAKLDIDAPTSKLLFEPCRSQRR